MVDRKNMKFEVLRPDDLVTLQFETRNLRLDTSRPADPRLVIQDPHQRAYLIVRFPPQAISEKAYFETAAHVSANPPFNVPPPPPLPGGDDPLDPPGATPSLMGATSRLVFRLPAGTQGIPYRLDALLDWSQFELMLSSTAMGRTKPPPLVPPGQLETALELPFRLLMSPTGQVGWAHASQPVTHAGWTELWHTRLARFRQVAGKRELQEASDTGTVPLRAIWARDFVDHAPLPGLGDIGPYRTALSRRDRTQIVILTSGQAGYYVPGQVGAGDGSAWVPEPVRASRLFLSSLGGWLTSQGDWAPLPSYTATDGSVQSLDLTEWRHLATEGRDHYVRVVYEGYLYPLGHLASLVKVTERKVVPPGGTVTSPTAYLRQHMYIVVREREKAYDPGTFTYGGREMPFLRDVRIETIVTPDINPPAIINNCTASFWIDVGSSGFPFHVSATDLSGARIDMHAQLIFMSVSEQSLQGVQSEYRSQAARRGCAVRGQKVAYADPAAGDTTLRTVDLEFDTQTLLPAPPYVTLPFLPYLSQATVTVPVIEELLGTANGTDITLYQGYKENGLDSHAGVYAELTTSQSLTFTADKAGGFATPNLMITALSARKGIVAGPAADAAAGLIDPVAFFGNVSVPGMIFGTVPLKDLIPIPQGGKADASRNAPEIRTHLVPDAKHPQSVVAQVKWQPDLHDYDEDPVKLLFNQNGPSSLTLLTKITRTLAGGPPSAEVSGKLTNFRIDLHNVIALNVDSISFDSKNGSKPDVKAVLPKSHPVSFEGPLEFVQTLASILPPGIFGAAGPAIALTSSGIRVSYTLGLPPISIGVFSLEHISIMTGLDLPYVDGKPAFEFAFASRSSPFLLTVECLGGGGFVHLVVDTDGVQMVEGALEFGGVFSMDFGVASGGVHILGGIYFQLTGTSSDITGFVDIGGEVSVLGIISVSIDLNLSLSYQVSNGKQKVEGKATLTISVHVFFFSLSVQLSVERSFGSSAGDPGVADLISEADWRSYAEAFG
jgi:hypothetical protein